MASDGQSLDASGNGAVLHWPGRVLTGADVQHSLNGHREVVLVPRAILTPLAADELRARGVRIVRQAESAGQAVPAKKATWGYAQDRTHAPVQSAVRAVQREGVFLQELSLKGEGAPCRWARAVADCVARGEYGGGVVFCQDTALICCVANKIAGLRAAAVCTVAEAARVVFSLGANLVAVEMPGRTFFEVRQILRTLCRPETAACPLGVAGTLQELDGHAHR
jgi:hypothetical protein